MVPLMMRAMRIAVIGDKQQLSHICLLSKQTDLLSMNKAKLFESVCKIGSRVDGIRDLPFFELVEKDERFKTLL